MTFHLINRDLGTFDNCSADNELKQNSQTRRTKAGHLPDVDCQEDILASVGDMEQEVDTSEFTSEKKTEWIDKIAKYLPFVKQFPNTTFATTFGLVGGLCIGTMAFLLINSVTLGVPLLISLTMGLGLLGGVMGWTLDFPENDQGRSEHSVSNKVVDSEEQRLSNMKSISTQSFRRLPEGNDSQSLTSWQIQEMRKVPEYKILEQSDWRGVELAIKSMDALLSPAVPQSSLQYRDPTKLVVLAQDSLAVAEEPDNDAEKLLKRGFVNSCELIKQLRDERQRSSPTGRGIPAKTRHPQSRKYTIVSQDIQRIENRRINQSTGSDSRDPLHGIVGIGAKTVYDCYRYSKIIRHEITEKNIAQSLADTAFRAGDSIQETESRMRPNRIGYQSQEVTERTRKRNAAALRQLLDLDNKAQDWSLFTQAYFVITKLAQDDQYTGETKAAILDLKCVYDEAIRNSGAGDVDSIVSLFSEKAKKCSLDAIDLDVRLAFHAYLPFLVAKRIAVQKHQTQQEANQRKYDIVNQSLEFVAPRGASRQQS
ncbi:hypothetical protein AB1K70_03490 [Bremerella sp. JC770]|uniref:hypothetical protein n=1 Tax=Bremerella sp. JC770 TaxID=3232137 RepID=UPI00345872BC